MITKHALRNALVPVVTVVGFEVGVLISGAAIAEIIFGLPGVGYQLLHAIFQRDYPVVQAATLLIAFVFIVVNFFVDILYGVLDPEDHRHMTAAVAKHVAARPERRRLALPARWRNPIGIAGAVIVGFVVLTALFGRPDLDDRPQQPGMRRACSPRAGRIRWAPTTSAATRSRGSSTARRSRSRSGAVAVGISLTLGLLIGRTRARSTAAVVDLVLMRFVDIVFAFPRLDPRDPDRGPARAVPAATR